MTNVTPDTPTADADLLATVEASETAAKPEPEPAAPPATPAKPRDRVAAAFFALVLGGVIAAAAGFALARLAPELLATPATPNAEIEALKQQIAALPAPDPALSDRLSAVESALSQLTDRLAAAESRPAGAADPAVAEQLAALQDRVAAIGTGTAQPAAITQAVAAAEARLKQAEEKAAALAEQAEAAAANTRRAASLDRIAAALDSGTPYAAALADLPDLPPALADHAATGLPSVATLRETFPAAARAALESALRANMGESWTDRVSSFLRSQTGLRSLTPRTGDDPDAVLSRAEAALSTGNVAQALTEIEALPDSAKPAMEDWTAQARIRTEGEAALAGLVGAQ